MKMKCCVGAWRRKAFSLIELMVAMAVLGIIVVMMAALFQQTSVSWKAGDTQSKRYSLLRGALGAIERDLVSAVDARVLFRDMDQLKEQKFSASGMTFFILKAPTRDLSDGDYAKRQREIHKITYKLGGTVERTEEYWNNDRFDSASTVDLLAGGSISEVDGSAGSGNADENISVSVSYVNRHGGSSLDDGEIPSAVLLKVSIDNEFLKTYDVGVMSRGPDGLEDTDDDIRTWVK